MAKTRMAEATQAQMLLQHAASKVDSDSVTPGPRCSATTQAWGLIRPGPESAHNDSGAGRDPNQHTTTRAQAGTRISTQRLGRRPGPESAASTVDARAAQLARPAPEGPRI
jgi:hypothetical protein